MGSGAGAGAGAFSSGTAGFEVLSLAEPIVEGAVGCVVGRLDNKRLPTALLSSCFVSTCGDGVGACLISGLGGTGAVSGEAGRAIGCCCVVA